MADAATPTWTRVVMVLGSMLMTEVYMSWNGPPIGSECGSFHVGQHQTASLKDLLILAPSVYLKQTSNFLLLRPPAIAPSTNYFHSTRSCLMSPSAATGQAMPTDTLMAVPSVLATLALIGGLATTSSWVVLKISQMHIGRSTR